jgi:hypothetical protein
MCRHDQKTNIRVNVPAEMSHDGSPYWTEKPIDACIAGIVSALNDAGILTASCCCGHGKRQGSILLQDGRELKVKS